MECVFWAKVSLIDICFPLKVLGMSQYKKFLKLWLKVTWHQIGCPNWYQFLFYGCRVPQFKKSLKFWLKVAPNDFSFHFMDVGCPNSKGFWNFGSRLPQLISAAPNDIGFHFMDEGSPHSKSFWNLGSRLPNIT